MTGYIYTFAGSVNGTPPEPSIMDAYRNLRESVYNHTTVLMMANGNPGGFGIDPYMMVTFHYCL